MSKRRVVLVLFVLFCLVTLVGAAMAQTVRHQSMHLQPGERGVVFCDGPVTITVTERRPYTTLDCLPEGAGEHVR